MRQTEYPVLSPIVSVETVKGESLISEINVVMRDSLAVSLVLLRCFWSLRWRKVGGSGVLEKLNTKMLAEVSPTRHHDPLTPESLGAPLKLCLNNFLSIKVDVESL